jgi:hypothetical protein
MRSLTDYVVDSCMALKTIKAMHIQLGPVIITATWVALMKQDYILRRW